MGSTTWFLCAAALLLVCVSFVPEAVAEVKECMKNDGNKKSTDTVQKCTQHNNAACMWAESEDGVQKECDSYTCSKEQHLNKCFVGSESKKEMCCCDKDKCNEVKPIFTTTTAAPPKGFKCWDNTRGKDVEKICPSNMKFCTV